MFGILQGNMRLDKVFLSSVSAGCLLSFSAASALSTNAASWYQDNAPGLIRTIGALVFPYGLVMIILTGADLCTGSFMVFPILSEFICVKTNLYQYTTVAVLHRRLPVPRMLFHWAVTFLGNLAGALFVVAIIFGCKSQINSRAAIRLTFPIRRRSF